MNRKKRLRLFQISFLIIGTLIIYLTYSKKNQPPASLVSQEIKNKVEKQANNTQDGDIFYNIEYSGLDFSGNRYILKSKEAFNTKNNKEITNMKYVEAIFYFKDETVLNVWSNKGIYNNKTLDMTFYEDVKGLYEGAELYARKAEYSNTKSYLIISDDVKVKDFRGNMEADKLLFDLKKQKLIIDSFNDDKINANIILK